jgi:type VI secretion system protein ImpF
MSSRRVEPTAQQSLIDRLVDDDPRAAADRVPGWAESVAALKTSVLRDLAWLLNTRQTPECAPAQAYPELHASLYHYGLPDTTSLSADADESRKMLVERIEQCIRLFEPRLANVRVVLREDVEGGRHRIPFVIEALLRMEPNPERVEFDTVLEVTSGEFRVAGSDA